MARNPKQDANLKPIKKGELTSEEAKSRGHNGGVKSGKTRRAKRDAKQAALRLLDMAAKGKMRDNLVELGYDPKDADGIKNVDVLVARLLVMSAAGNLQATDKLIKIAGWDAEENRAERESINADRRRDQESEARLLALEKGDVQRYSSAYTDTDDDGSVEDVFIYLPDNGRDKNLQKSLNREAGSDDETGVGGSETNGEDYQTAGGTAD